MYFFSQRKRQWGFTSVCDLRSVFGRTHPFFGSDCSMFRFDSTVKQIGPNGNVKIVKSACFLPSQTDQSMARYVIHIITVISLFFSWGRLWGIPAQRSPCDIQHQTSSLGDCRAYCKIRMGVCTGTSADCLRLLKSCGHQIEKRIVGRVLNHCIIVLQ